MKCLPKYTFFQHQIEDDLDPLWQTDWRLLLVYIQKCEEKLYEFSTVFFEEKKQDCTSYKLDKKALSTVIWAHDTLICILQASEFLEENGNNPPKNTTEHILILNICKNKYQFWKLLLGCHNKRQNIFLWPGHFAFTVLMYEMSKTSTFRLSDFSAYFIKLSGLLLCILAGPF